MRKSRYMFWGLLLAGTFGGWNTAAAATVTDSDFSGSTDYAESVTFNLSTAGAVYNYAGVVSGTGSVLTKTGAAQLTLGKAQTYTGATVISGGTLAVSNVSFLGTSSGVTLSSGAVLKYTGQDTVSLTPTLTVTDAGTVDFYQDTTNVLTLKLSGDANAVATLAGKSNMNGASSVSSFALNANAFAGTVRVTGGKLRITSDLTNIAGYILDGGMIMNGDGNGTDGAKTISKGILLGENGGALRPGFNLSTRYTGKITGAGALSLSGDSGNIYLSNSENDYSGGTVIGTTFNGNAGNSRLYLGANNALGTGVVSFSGNLDSNVLDLNGFSITTTPVGGLSAPTQNSVLIRNSGTTASTLTLRVADDAAYVYNGRFSGNTNLVMSGAGTQTLSGENIAYTGSTTVNGGTLILSTSTGNTSGFFLNGGTLQQTKDAGFTEANANYTFNGGMLALSATGGMNLKAVTVLAGGGGIQWTVGGTAALDVKLNGQNTTADTVFKLQGTTNPTGNCNTFTVSSLTGYNGKIEIAGGKLNANGTVPFSVSGYILSGGTLMLNRGGTTTYSGTLEVKEGTSGSLRAGTYGTVNLTGKISGSGELGISGDNGVFVFANSENTFSGGLNIGVKYNIGGEAISSVQLGANNALGTGAVSFTSGTTRLNLAGYSLTTTPVAGLSSTLSSALLTNSESGKSTLTLNPDAGKTYSYAGIMTGNIDVIKTGAGTQIFAGSFTSASDAYPKTYSGDILIQEGTLEFSDKTFSLITSAVTVGTSGTLALSDTNLSLEDLELMNGGKISFDTNSDAILFSTEKFLGTDGDFSASWDGTDLLFSPELNYLLMPLGGGVYTLNANAVPEPSAWLLLLCGLLGGMRFFCKKNMHTDVPAA